MTMLSFEEYAEGAFLIEGGNVQIGDVAAERIDLNRIKRSEIIPKLDDSLREISKAFEEQFGFPLWKKAILQSREFLSGSALHFFKTDVIDDESFVAAKDTVGDIDTQVDGDMASQLETFLSGHKGQTFGDLIYVGFKKSPAQLISLWTSKTFEINIQIDFELVGYEDGRPTSWAQFSHSSHWEDLAEGIKGVFQKYLFRSLTHLTTKDIVILPKTPRGKEKILNTNMMAFSVDKGLRDKYAPVMEGGKQVMKDGKPVYQELETANSKYVTDLDIIYQTLFKKTPTPRDTQELFSFLGIIRLIRSNFSTTIQNQIVETFSELLWGRGAQGLMRGDPLGDLKTKKVSFNYLIKNIGSKTIDAFKPKINEYYKNYK